MDSYIIYTDMVGDLCHSNHIKHLEKCKQFKKNSVVYVLDYILMKQVNNGSDYL